MESKSSPLILFMKELKEIVQSVDMCSDFEIELKALTGKIGVIASHTQTDIEENKDGSGEEMKLLSHLFPTKVTIQSPQDEALLVKWKLQLDRDRETMRSQSNIVIIRTSLKALDLYCLDLETLHVKDQVLTTESVHKIIGWAISHNCMQFSEDSVKVPESIISAKKFHPIVSYTGSTFYETFKMKTNV
ncbi:hypothetical protein ACS0TY_023522 [Phlomoides rotata]